MPGNILVFPGVPRISGHSQIYPAISGHANGCDLKSRCTNQTRIHTDKATSGCVSQHRQGLSQNEGTWWAHPGQPTPEGWVLRRRRHDSDKLAHPSNNSGDNAWPFSDFHMLCVRKYMLNGASLRKVRPRFDLWSMLGRFSTKADPGSLHSGSCAIGADKELEVVVLLAR